MDQYLIYWFFEQKRNHFPFILQSRMKIHENSIVILYPNHYTKDIQEMMFLENRKRVGIQPSILLSIGNNSTVFVKMTISPSSTYSKVRRDKK